MGTQSSAKKTQLRLTAPRPLKAGHKLESFSCGRQQIDDWLKKRAFRASEADTARTYVVTRGGTRVVGYYSLAAGAVEHAHSPRAVRRNAPEPIPVIILARLGVFEDEQGEGIGSHLLKDAMLRTSKAAKIIGARALIVHALDQEAAQYYEGHGFKYLSQEQQSLYIPLKTIYAAL